MSIRVRRDSFCGKMSVCNNLTQYGIPYSLTTQHTEAPDSTFPPAIWNGSGRLPRRPTDSAASASAPSARGLRPSTRCAIARSCWSRRHHRRTVDLSEILGRMARMKDDDPAAQAKLAAIKSYVPTDGIAPKRC